MIDQAATATAHRAVQRDRGRAAVQAAEPCPFRPPGTEDVLTLVNHSGPGGANMELPLLI